MGVNGEGPEKRIMDGTYSKWVDDGSLEMND